MIDVNKTAGSAQRYSTFDTENMQHYYGTEIDEKYDCDDYPDMNLEKNPSKGIPGTLPECSSPFGNMDIEN